MNFVIGDIICILDFITLNTRLLETYTVSLHAIDDFGHLTIEADTAFPCVPIMAVHLTEKAVCVWPVAKVTERFRQPNGRFKIVHHRPKGFRTGAVLSPLMAPKPLVVGSFARRPFRYHGLLKGGFEVVFEDLLGISPAVLCPLRPQPMY